MVREAAPIAAALLIAGAGGSAMTADMGARNIRDELAAMEVMAVNPAHRLVTPRLWAATTVGMLLVSLVIVAGVGGGFLFNVVLQGVSPGAYFQGADQLLRLSDLAVGPDQGRALRVHRRDGGVPPGDDTASAAPSGWASP